MREEWHYLGGKEFVAFATFPCPGGVRGRCKKDFHFKNILCFRIVFWAVFQKGKLTLGYEDFDTNQIQVVPSWILCRHRIGDKGI
jgi:hypothetical protein